MRQLNLPIVIREQPGLGPLQDSELPALKPRRVIAIANPAPARFDAHHLHALIAQKWPEKSDRVAPAAHARDEQIRQPPFAFQDLPPRFIRRSPDENRAPSSGTDALRKPCRGYNGWCGHWSPNRASLH